MNPGGVFQKKKTKCVFVAGACQMHTENTDEINSKEEIFFLFLSSYYFSFFKLSPPLRLSLGSPKPILKSNCIICTERRNLPFFLKADYNTH